jgi:hypothetical protein
VSGWHLHRHHPGQQFLTDTTNMGWGAAFYLATGGDLNLATSGVPFHGHGQERFSVAQCAVVGHQSVRPVLAV